MPLELKEDPVLRMSQPERALAQPPVPEQHLQRPGPTLSTTLMPPQFALCATAVPTASLATAECSKNTFKGSAQVNSRTGTHENECTCRPND